MTRLTIRGAVDGALIVETVDPVRIAEDLAGIGVRFEQWPLRDVADMPADAILAAYAPEIDRLKEAGRCIVVITHDFEFACATCEEIAHFENGRIAERFDLTPSTAPRARVLFGFD